VFNTKIETLAPFHVNMPQKMRQPSDARQHSGERLTRPLSHSCAGNWRKRAKHWTKTRFPHPSQPLKKNPLSKPMPLYSIREASAKLMLICKTIEKRR
jgi:hypothetical protein